MTREPRGGDDGFVDDPRYRPVRRLGQGGMGAVWEVEDRERGVRCALKVMRVGGAGDGLLRFKREFRSVADLSHPNLVRLFELATDGARWYYTMELVEGSDLLEAMRARDSDDATRGEPTDPSTETLPRRTSAGESDAGSARATTREACSLPATPCDLERLDLALPQLLDGLGFIHARGVVHRDLKPKNILFDRAGHLRVLDFGIAQHLSSDRLTAAGTIVGTLAYMSPEQCEEGAITPASDLYGLGCLLFHLLTGAPPFGSGSARVAVDHLLTPAPLVSSRVSGVPERYVALCRDLLHKLPAARPGLSEVRTRLGLSAVNEAALPAHASSAPALAPDEDDLLRRVLDSGAYVLIERRAELVVVGGASRSDGSTLAGRIANELRARGYEVLSGRCHERESLPFKAFDQIMDELALSLRRGAPTRWTGPGTWLAQVGETFPTIAAVAPRRAGTQASSSPRDAIATLFGELASTAPLAIVIDDLHFTDEASARVLEALTAARAPLLVVGLVRAGALPADHPLADLLARQPWVTRIACE